MSLVDDDGAAVDIDQLAATFDHRSAGYAKDPHAILGRLRAECPIAHSDSYGGFWVATRYEDVAAIARDDAVFSSAWLAPYQGGAASPPGNPYRMGFIEMDPPESLKYRRVVNPFFAPPAVDRITPHIRSIARNAIDSFIEQGRADIVCQYGEVIPALTTMHIMGLPTDRWRDYVEFFHHATGADPDSEEHRSTQDDDNLVHRELTKLLEDRRRHPRDDGLSQLVQAEIDGRPMSDRMALECATLLMIGGLDTTAALLANSILYLSENPDDRRRLAAQPELLPSACEEFLRYFSPVQNLGRTVTQTCEIGGRTLEPGDRVLISWAAANRDAEQFPDPETVDLERFPNRHQAFGLGSHRCAGSTLARREFEVAISELLERVPDYRVLVDQSRRYDRLGSNNGWISMPIEFTPGRPSAEPAG
jgi:cytochrome P450